MKAAYLYSSTVVEFRANVDPILPVRRISCAGGKKSVRDVEPPRRLADLNARGLGFTQ